ncbi:hypothetical protein ACFRFH_16935 [Leifsonia sp. NPDC056824]|uniref:hypothetical protein n=1 Tax=Leifsonia sp. NPDC056824 TaxID=3345953 RepID=UPI0036B22111
MDTNDAENGSGNDASKDAGNDADNAAGGDVSDPENGRELPTEPLPWWVEAHDGVAGDTAPLGTVASAPTAGRTVTDSMKAGEPERTSFLRRHVVGLSIAAAALAIVVVAGGTAWGVSAAIAGGDSAAPAAMNSAMHAKKGGAGGSAAKQKRSHGTVGTLTGMSGGTWTIQSAAGATVTVTVGSGTTFGTAKKPATESSFAVGDRIGVIGTRSGDSVTATRIVHVGAAKNGTMATAAPTPNT